MDALPESLQEPLIGLADELIPAGSGLPSGGAVLARGDVATVLAELPDLLSATERAVAGVADVDPERRLAALEGGDPDGLAAVGELVAAVYFLDPEISRLVGYRRREAVPISFDPDLVDLTRPVIALGFRSPVPEAD